MTVTIQSGPSWVSLDSRGALTGVPPAAGSYEVVLASTAGAFSSTKTVTIVVTELAATLLDTVARMLNLGSLRFQFGAEVGTQVASQSNVQFTFSAEVVVYAYLGLLSMGFSATAGEPTVIPEEFSVPLPPNTQELVSGTALQDSYTSASTKTSPFAYRIIKPNVGLLSLSITDIALASGASSVEMYLSLREDQYSGVSLSLSGNDYWSSTSNWSQGVSGLPPGIYYLDIEIPDNVTNALSTFTVTGTWDTTLSDANEPNFSLKTARTLQLGIPSSNKLTVNDTDWFKLSTTGTEFDYKGISLLFDQMTQPNGETPGIAVDVFQVNLDGSLGSQINASGSLNIIALTSTVKRLEPQAPGMYAVRVKYLSGEYTNYRLTGTQFSVPVDSYEDDGSMALATVLTNGSPSTGHTLNAGDEDWFKVQLASPAVLTISLTNIVISDYLEYPSVSFSVVRPNGLSVEDFYQAFIGRESSPASGATSDTTVTRSTATTLNAGTYYIQVINQNDAYDLTASW